MPKYFTLTELVRSNTALNKKIENIPSWESVEHLKELAGFLDKLREDYGKPIFVSSGYRSPQLNRTVGGVSSSVHQIGYAADLQTSDMAGFIKFVKEWAVDKDFDQILIESSKTTTWVHVGLYNNKGEQRHKVFGIVVK